jgi:hypothetical protein
MGYYAGLCRDGSEIGFELRNYKCAICKRDDVLTEKAEKEAERLLRMEDLIPKGKGRGRGKRRRRGVGKGLVKEGPGEK